MNIYTKTAIKIDAERAAKLGETPNQACPYSFYTVEGLHWVACYEVAHMHGLRQIVNSGIVDR